MTEISRLGNVVMGGLAADMHGVRVCGLIAAVSLTMPDGCAPAQAPAGWHSFAVRGKVGAARFFYFGSGQKMALSAVRIGFGGTEKNDDICAA